MLNYSLQSLLLVAKDRLKGSDTPMLDARLLMMHVTGLSKESILAWPQRQLLADQVEEFERLVSKREQGEPIAYITGHKAFWSLDLKVTPDVLIPRPETELIVETVLDSLGDQEEVTLLDLGTGSGAIALAIASEKPLWHITAIDQSLKALDIAIQNAENYQLQNVTFLQGAWCDPLSTQVFDVIVSNPPYVAQGDPHLTAGDVHFEPREALVSGHHGFDDLFEIAKQAWDYLAPGGLLVLEHGFEQAKKLSAKLASIGYTDIKTHRDIANLDRVTTAKREG